MSMKLKIEVNIPDDTGLTMENNLNKAISDFSEALSKRGFVEMELEALDFDNEMELIYKIQILQ